MGARFWLAITAVPSHWLHPIHSSPICCLFNPTRSRFVLVRTRSTSRAFGLRPRSISCVLGLCLITLVCACCCRSRCAYARPRTGPWFVCARPVHASSVCTTLHQAVKAKLVFSEKVVLTFCIQDSRYLWNKLIVSFIALLTVHWVVVVVKGRMLRGSHGHIRFNHHVTRIT